jgi:hypothetical protein
MLSALTDRLAERLTCEVEDLAFELFCGACGFDWGKAIETAIAELPALIDYADEWDMQALALACAEVQ